jgi:microsomal dipeptidase-like Zn-dependent dipeptidase
MSAHPGALAIMAALPGALAVMSALPGTMAVMSALPGCTPVTDGGLPPGSGAVLEPTPTPAPPQDHAPVTGFADLHNHQFAEYAYQGAWYHGTTLGPEGGDDRWTGMAACDGNWPGGPQDHAMTYMNVLCDVAGLATDDMCVHTDRKYGYVDGARSDLNYSGWPHSTSWAHQQTWWGHLQDAHEDGLNITVVHMVNFKILCEVMEPGNYRYSYGCEDMGAVDLEIAAAKEFADLNADWVEIAYSPADARRIIHAGKLAMVLAIEITDLFPTGAMDDAPAVYDENGTLIDRGGVLTQLRRYYDLGVRTLQLGHELDSRFAGVAVYSPIFEVLDAIRTFKEQHPGELEDVALPGDGDPRYGFQLDEDGYNELGLTDDGKQLVQALMQLGMILDIAHLSYNSDRDVYALTKANRYYPIMHSHSKLSEIMVLPGEEALEKYTPDWVVDMLNATGGMAGLRTFSARVNTYPESGVENSCDGSTRSFVQAYAYADRELHLPVGLGVDFNGFTNQVDPRFGDAACNKAVDEVTQLDQQALQVDAGTGTDFDRIGLGHMGLVGRGLLDDMKALGADTRNLESSAEHFIRMWERAVDPDRSGPVGPPPVSADSDLHRKLSSSGLTLTSIIAGPEAAPGVYSFRVSGTGTAKEVQLVRDGSTLVTVAYDTTERVTDLKWRTFAFGEHLTVKIGASSSAGADLSSLETAFFDGVRTVTLAYP